MPLGSSGVAAKFPVRWPILEGLYMIYIHYLNLLILFVIICCFIYLLPPDMHTVRIRGKEMFVLWKIWHALFSWNTCFEIHPFALLPTNYQNEAAEATHYHGAIQQCYEKDNREMLTIYFLCLLSIILTCRVNIITKYKR